MLLSLEITTILLLGLVLGSFATAISYREGMGFSWLWGMGARKRSSCPHCGAQLRARDLIPLLSWLLLKGRCRDCAYSIGTRYPIIELGVVLACLGLYARYGMPLNPVLTISYAVIPFIAALCAIDIEKMLLPNRLVATIFALGIIRLAWVGDEVTLALINHLGGAVIYGGMFWLVGLVIAKMRGKDALGFGDVKLLAAIGLWLGIGTLPLFCMLAGTLGVVLALIWRVMKKGDVFPFGPALIVAFYILL